MESTSFLSGSDNFLKYLFTVGAVMIVVSILYPLQKSQEIELLKSDLLKNAELLSKEIGVLKSEFEEDQSLYRNMSIRMDSLLKKYDGEVKSNEDFLSLRIKANKIINELKDKERELEIKNIILKNDNSKVLLLKGHAESYKSYYTFIKTLGVLFLIIGFIGWSISTFVKERLQWLNLQEKERLNKKEQEVSSDLAVPHKESEIKEDGKSSDNNS